MKSLVYKLIPDCNLKDWIWWYYKKESQKYLLNEIVSLPFKSFEETGQGIPYIELEDGKKFLGYATFQQETRMYRMLEGVLEPVVPLRWFGIASDIVTRYENPQPIPTFPCRLDIKYREAFSKHHTEVLNDIPIERRGNLVTKFTPTTGWTVIDVGAYLGYSSMRMSNMVGLDGKVISFECSPYNIEIFRKNTEVNGISNIKLIPWVAWNNRQDLLELSKEEEPHSRTLFGYGKGGKVNTETIDHVVNELSLQRVDLISYTINGAEPEALEGSINTLKRFHPVLSVTGWFKVKGQPVWKRCIPFLESLGYKVYRFPKGRILAWLE